jgi:hypothetical protein
MTNLEQFAEPTAPLDLPDWLSTDTPDPDPDPTPDTTTIPATQSKTQKELLHLQYESFFMRVIELIPQGKTLKSIIEQDMREFEYGSFLRWINKDPHRKALYSDAKELRTETWAGEIIEIADALDSVEDVNRSKLRIDSRKWLMGADFRKQYGASTQIEIGGAISILTALDAANARVISMDDVTDVTPRLENN